MYHELSKKEIKKFIKKYLYPSEKFEKYINSISCISDSNFYEYLINNEFILRIPA